MDRLLYDILDNVNVGIVLLNEKLEVSFWNNYMVNMVGISIKQALESSIFEVLPNLNTNYFNTAFTNVMSNGYKMFFSEAMHNGLINDKEKFNLKISRIDVNESRFLMLEFENVTGEFVRISQLKENINELRSLNKQLKWKEKVIRKLAYYDKLTGVANRTLFYEVGDKFLNAAKRSNSLLGLIFLDVDKFKDINDTYGHEVGDKVLVRIAKILKESTRKDDIVARFGGDEFLVLLTNVKSANDHESVISRIKSSKKNIMNFKDGQINISYSMGISFYPKNGNTIDELISKADEAMYTAKRTGENDRCFVWGN